jgi:hypothetical protein
MIYILDAFIIETQISPLQLARMDKLKRLRAGRREKEKNKPESDW